MFNKDNLIKGCIFLIIFLMLFIPAQLMKVKMIIVFVLLLASLIYIIVKRERIRISKGVFWWFTVYILASVFFTILSFVYGNPGATTFLVVNIISPAIYFIFIVTLSNLKIFEEIKVSFVIATLCIVIYNFVYAMSLNGIIKFINPKSFPFIKENVGGMDVGFVKITSENISVLMFLVPFVIALYFVEKKRSAKVVCYIIIVLGALSAVLSVRTAFLLIIGLTPFIIIALDLLTKTDKYRVNIKKVLIALTTVPVLLILLIGVFSVDINLVVKKATGSFNVSDINSVDSKESADDKKPQVDMGSDNGGYIRAEQMKDLIDTWKMKPIFGWGEGANALNVVRSDTPGLYELTFLALLMQRGVVGFVLFIGQILCIYIMSIKNIRRNTNTSDLNFAALVGLTTILVAHATNPYLYSFDRLILFFFPLLMVQYSAINENKNGYERGNYYGWNNISRWFRN